MPPDLGYSLTITDLELIKLVSYKNRLKLELRTEPGLMKDGMTRDRKGTETIGTKEDKSEVTYIEGIRGYHKSLETDGGRPLRLKFSITASALEIKETSIV